MRPRRPSGTNRIRLRGVAFCADAALAASAIRPADSNTIVRRIRFSPIRSSSGDPPLLRLVLLCDRIVTDAATRPADGKHDCATHHVLPLTKSFRRSAGAPVSFCSATGLLQAISPCRDGRWAYSTRDTGSIERQPHPRPAQNAIEAAPLWQPCRGRGLPDRSVTAFENPYRAIRLRALPVPHCAERLVTRKALRRICAASTSCGVSPAARAGEPNRPPPEPSTTGRKAGPAEQGSEQRGLEDIDELSWDAPAFRRCKHTEQWLFPNRKTIKRHANRVWPGLRRRRIKTPAKVV